MYHTYQTINIFSCFDDGNSNVTSCLDIDFVDFFAKFYSNLGFNRADMRKWGKINISFFWIVSLKLLNLLIKKSLQLMHRLKKLSAVQKKLKIENLTKNGMHKPLACVYVEILVIPYTCFRAAR